jgi:predicted signal transduction protein with EAL and GGDEF domain
MARRLQACAPEGSLVARLGGDEFACAVRYRGPSLETVDQIAQGVIARFGAPVDNDVFAGTVSVAIASPIPTVSPAGAGPADAAALLHVADLACFRPRSWAQPGVVVRGDDGIELRYRCEMEAAIRAVPGGRIRALLRTAGGSGQRRDSGLRDAGALAFAGVRAGGPMVHPHRRGNRRHRGYVEKLIVQALADAREWDPRLTSVNVSPLQLRDPWFAQKLLKLLVAANFPPSRLEIEITESACTTMPAVHRWSPRCATGHCHQPR